MFFLCLSGGAAYGETQEKIGKMTKLPLPRFVSLKANAVNLRAGPGTAYPIKWLYKKQGLPVEIIDEFERWRKIRTSDGKTTGWVLHSLLSAKRTGFVASWQVEKDETGKIINAPLLEGRKYASTKARINAKMQAGLMVEIIECKNNWCQIEAQNTKSWLPQENLWGTYPGEQFK